MPARSIIAVMLIVIAFDFFSIYCANADPQICVSSEGTTVSLELMRIEGGFKNIFEEIRKGNYQDALLHAQEIAKQNANRDINLYWIAKFHILTIYLDTGDFLKAIPLIEEVLDSKEQILGSDVLSLYVGRETGVENPEVADFYLGSLLGTLSHCYSELGLDDKARLYAHKYVVFLKGYQTSLAGRQDISEDHRAKIQDMIDSALNYTEKMLKQVH